MAFKPGDKVIVHAEAVVVEQYDTFTTVQIEQGDAFYAEVLVMTSTLSLAPPAPSPGQLAYDAFWEQDRHDHMSWDQLDASVRAKWERVAEAARA